MESPGERLDRTTFWARSQQLDCVSDKASQARVADENAFLLSQTLRAYYTELQGQQYRGCQGLKGHSSQVPSDGREALQHAVCEYHLPASIQPRSATTVRCSGGATPHC